MIPIIYESTETAFISNGLGRLRDCFTCTVTEERNGIFECDFTYPIDGANFDLIQPGRIITVYHDDTKSVEPFDIVSYSKPINGIVAFHAVHVSYRLGGVVSRAKNINSLDAAMQAIVETAQPSAVMGQFTFTKDFESTGYMAAFDYVPRSVRQLMGGIEGSILDTYGGEWEFRGFNVVLHSARGTLRDFTIRYGLNMLDYNDDTDYSGVFTSCIPHWIGVDANGGETVVTGAKVDSGFSSYSGRDICIPLDLTDKFEDKPTQAQLRTAALNYMTANQTTLPAQTISVDFVRLQDMGEFAQFESLLRCGLCDSINVVFPRYKMQGTFKIVKTVYNVLAERYDGMELGSLSTTLAEALGISQSAETLDRINDLAIGGDLSVGGDATVAGALSPGSLVLQNGADNGLKIYDGGSPATLRNALYVVTSNNNFVIGYPWYTGAVAGDMYIGGNTLRLMSQNPIVLNQPLAGLYKITSVAVEVAAIGAHANISASNHTMTAQSGYNAVGIVGWSTSNYRISPATNYVSSNTIIYAGFKNTSATATTTTTTITFRVLWLNATAG